MVSKAKRNKDDFPFDEVRKAADKVLARYPTAHVYQKYTCEGCGARLTIDVPNAFHETGACDRCPTITNIRERGCNYMLTFGVPPPSQWTSK